MIVTTKSGAKIELAAISDKVHVIHNNKDLGEALPTASAAHGWHLRCGNAVVTIAEKDAKAVKMLIAKTNPADPENKGLKKYYSDLAKIEKANYGSY